MYTNQCRPGSGQLKRSYGGCLRDHSCKHQKEVTDPKLLDKGSEGLPISSVPGLYENQNKWKGGVGNAATKIKAFDAGSRKEYVPNQELMLARQNVKLCKQRIPRWEIIHPITDLSLCSHI